MPFDPHRDDGGAPLPTCTDTPIIHHAWESERFGAMATISYILGWTHPGWGWSICRGSRRDSGASCEVGT